MRCFNAKMMALTALAGLFLSGCGASYPYSPYGTAADPYGYGTTAGYGTTSGYDTGSYTTGYDSSSYSTGYDSSSYGSYSTSTTGYDSSSYGSTGSSYGTSYGSSYGTSYGTSYGSTYPTTGTYGTTVDPNTGYVTTAPSALTQPITPVATPKPSIADQPVLSAYVKDVKTKGLLGLGGATAHVEVSNPSNRTLSGLVKVNFLDGGHPAGNMQTRRVTLRPLETQELTFTASAFRLSDAEASVDTDSPVSTESTVVDRKK